MTEDYFKKKMDQGKSAAAMLADFSYALQAVAAVGDFGQQKGYGRGSWQEVPDAIPRYTDALWRHLLSIRHETFDTESSLMHLYHLAWNCLAVLELTIREQHQQSTEENSNAAQRIHPTIRPVSRKDNDSNGLSGDERPAEGYSSSGVCGTGDGQDAEGSRVVQGSLLCHKCMSPANSNFLCGDIGCSEKEARICRSC